MYGSTSVDMINRISYKQYFWQAAIFCSCLFVLGCENDEKVINDWNEKKEMVEVAHDVTSLFSQNGNLRAKLKAPLMLRYQGDTVKVEFPETLHVDFFDSTRKVESWLDARFGRYYESNNRVLLKDSVKVINIKGDTLTTPELWWDQNLRKFYTDSVVRIVTKDKRIRGGKGLEAGQDLTWYTIRQPTGTVLVGREVMLQ
jgi:LPS export ABC transporter protein LptC